ncbi:RNA-guided endonuclease TnpB family protein [Acidianus sp. RZ1]|uniref:RNA-guided endonuclease InsQ/TnpB family protein n=1 Tax=Acidianus sp. RZ1 TaxID=1540082 RepID=UPI001491401C|nr:RNA-guided endonuclease TnpB family protein [Acidianus sp. RZ1]NON62077.1 IS200/IS605 family element transposase accessory protein TnpB [Acidianus sp. RZ1]
MKLLITASIFFYERDGKGLSQTELRQLALDLRKQDEEYQHLHSQVVQAIADRYYNALEEFLNKQSRFPKEKREDNYNSLVYPQAWMKKRGKLYPNGWKLTDKNKKFKILHLSHLGDFKIRIHRQFPVDKVKQIIVKLTKSGKVFVIFIVENYEFPKLKKTGKKVAIDVGIYRLLTTSDGYYVENPRRLEKKLERLKWLSQSLSRKEKGSNNFEKMRVKIAKTYESRVNFRHDLYYKLGKFFAESYDSLAMEDIKVKQLVSRSARVLRLHLHDVGFYEMREIFKWQMEKYGKEFKVVNPAYTSRTCPKCGFVKENMPLSERVFVCPKCGYVGDRDHVGALNILSRAEWDAPLAPVELTPLPLSRQGLAMKQEPHSLGGMHSVV